MLVGPSVTREHEDKDQMWKYEISVFGGGVLQMLWSGLSVAWLDGGGGVYEYAVCVCFVYFVFL